MVGQAPGVERDRCGGRIRLGNVPAGQVVGGRRHYHFVFDRQVPVGPGDPQAEWPVRQPAGSHGYALQRRVVMIDATGPVGGPQHGAGSKRDGRRRVGVWLQADKARGVQRGDYGPVHTIVREMGNFQASDRFRLRYPIEPDSHCGGDTGIGRARGDRPGSVLVDGRTTGRSGFPVGEGDGQTESQQQSHGGGKEYALHFACTTSKMCTPCDYSKAMSSMQMMLEP